MHVPFSGAARRSRVSGSRSVVRTRAADRIAHLKKGDMATEAEALLADTGWLPEPLRTPGEAEQSDHETIGDPAEPESGVAETVAEDGETAMGTDDVPDENDDAEATSHVVAAE